MNYGLVLAGGGVRGAYQIGVWEALLELGIKISAISGASIGAVNGALFAQGDFDAAKKLWREVSIDDIVAMPEKISSSDNLFEFKNITELIREISKSDGLDMSPLEHLLRSLIDEDKLRKSPIDLGIAAFSLNQKSGIYKFKADIPYGEIVEYVMASACMPGFKPRAVDADRLLDGGVSNNMPVNLLLEKDIYDIITVDVKGIGFCKSFNLTGRNVIEIACKTPQTGIMEFDHDGIETSIRSGYLDCMKAFGHLKGDIYSFPSADYHKARMKYSASLLSSLEQAAKVFDIDPWQIYSVDGLIKETLGAYNAYTEKSDESVFEKIRGAGDNVLTVWLIKLLESGKSDFLMEKLSLIGPVYNAASAIIYFNGKK